MYPYLTEQVREICVSTALPLTHITFTLFQIGHQLYHIRLADVTDPWPINSVGYNVYTLSFSAILVLTGTILKLPLPRNDPLTYVGRLCYLNEPGEQWDVVAE